MEKKGRFFGVTFIIVVCFIGLIGRLFFVSVIAKDKIYDKALAQIAREITIPAKRGDILDRNGSILASSTESYRVDADLETFRKTLERKEKTANYYSDQIAEILDMDKDEVNLKLTKENNGVIIKRKISKDASDKIYEFMEKENVNFLIVGYDNIRHYPNDNFLAHSLGSVNIDSEGVLGLENYYDEELRGVDGVKITEIDRLNRELPYKDALKTDPVNGSDLVLTIDEKVQYLIENVAAEAMEKHEALGVTILVSNPNTGEILGLVNLPDFNPNNPGEGLTQDEYNKITRNRAVNDAYEPGSTFKIITIATGLQNNTVNMESEFYCEGYTLVDGIPIRCALNKKHKHQFLSDVMVNSCNASVVDIGLKIGKENLDEYIHKFNLGEKTGIDLPGEASGILMNPDNMRNIDLASISIGQSNTVTPVQILSALNVIVNKGVYKSLHLGKEAVLKDSKGNIVTRKELYSKEEKEIIDKENAAKVLFMLNEAVSQNELSGAYTEDLEIFGKTGTAQKVDPETKAYSDTDFIASFIGGAPYSNPKYTVAVIVDTPIEFIYGNTVAAPIGKEILLELDKMDIED
ncbi:MAG: stage V sporulation protein D [Clostridium sp.]|nr:stage V sporulation protein D [Clostridium sp.]